MLRQRACRSAASSCRIQRLGARDRGRMDGRGRALARDRRAARSADALPSKIVPDAQAAVVALRPYKKARMLQACSCAAERSRACFFASAAALGGGVGVANYAEATRSVVTRWPLEPEHSSRRLAGLRGALRRRLRCGLGHGKWWRAGSRCARAPRRLLCCCWRRRVLWLAHSVFLEVRRYFVHGSRSFGIEVDVWLPCQLRQRAWSAAATSCVTCAERCGSECAGSRNQSIAPPVSATAAAPASQASGTLRGELCVSMTRALKVSCSGFLNSGAGAVTSVAAVGTRSDVGLAGPG